jgi:hypothetical protein
MLSVAHAKSCEKHNNCYSATPCSSHACSIHGTLYSRIPCEVADQVCHCPYFHKYILNIVCLWQVTIIPLQAACQLPTMALACLFAPLDQRLWVNSCVEQFTSLDRVILPALVLVTSPISVQVTLPTHFQVILKAPEWVNLFTAHFQVIDYKVILSAYAGVNSPTGAQLIVLACFRAIDYREILSGCVGIILPTDAQVILNSIMAHAWMNNLDACVWVNESNICTLMAEFLNQFTAFDW